MKTPAIPITPAHLSTPIFSPQTLISIGEANTLAGTLGMSSLGTLGLAFSSCSSFSRTSHQCSGRLLVPSLTQPLWASLLYPQYAAFSLLLC